MTKTRATVPDPLDILLVMPLRQRIAAVAADVLSGSNKFFGIDAFDLADALGVPEPEQPSEDWIFKPYYADCMSLEEYFENSGETEILDMLLGFVDGVRGAMLKEEFAKLDDDITTPSFNFLTIGERAYVDARILELTLKAYEDDGLCRVATYTVKDGFIELTFEAEVNAAGVTVALRTPYDERDGLFLGSRGLCH